MKITWFTPYPPSHPWHGGRIRVNNLMVRLSKFGHQIDCIALDPLGELDEQILEPMVHSFKGQVSSGWKDKAKVFLGPEPTVVWETRDSEAFAYSKASLANADLAIVEQANMFPYVKIAQDMCVPVVYASQNVESLLMKQMARNSDTKKNQARLYVESFKMKRIEGQLIETCTATTCVSEYDAAIFRNLSPQSQFEVIPNGVDLDTFEYCDHTMPRAANLIMTGTMGYFPNLQAARWLIQYAMPKIRRELPNATLTLVGQSPTKQLVDMAGSVSYVEITGQVPDVRPYVRHADLFVMPLKIGSGTRLKALEAMASGIPIVSSSIGCQGIPAMNGTHLLIADDAETFISECVRCIRDVSLRKTLATNSRSFVVDNYSWDILAKRFDLVLNSLSLR